MLVFINTVSMQKKQTEVEFGTQFIESGNLQRITRDPYHIREFETLNGIPDLVLISGSKLQLFKDFEKKYARISSTSGTARVLTFLNKKSFITQDNLVHLTGLSSSYLHKILRDLSHIGAIESREGKEYRIESSFEIPSPRIISIEFKLDNWHKALVQATRHSAFASRSYVIMPAAKHQLLKKNVRHFMVFGVSVGTFDVDSGDFRMIWKSPSNYGGKAPRSKVSYLDSTYRMINSLDRLEAIKV